MSLPADTVIAARPPTPARDLLLLSLLFAFVYFLPTGLRPLTNPDEGRYVEIAREMAVNHDFISPHLNGVLYFEKPPLFYWLETSAVALGGMNLWALRFWPIALAFLGVAAVYGTGRALWGRAAGWWSALALSTSLLYYGVSQVIILDTAVSVFLIWALCAFMLAVRAPPGPTRRNWCYALYASMALALMTKGLIGLLIPGAIIFLWLLLLNKWRELRHAHIVSGILILLVLGLPWHVAAALATPPPGGWDWAHFFSRDWHNQGFLWYYFVQQQFLRYLDHSVANRVQPWWFFFVLLPAGFFPWVFFLPSAIGSAIQGGWARMKSEPETLFLFLWTLFPLLFFSASSSKLVPYILPSVPPLALLTGRFIARSLEAQNAKSFYWPLYLLGGIMYGVFVGMFFWLSLGDFAIGDMLPGVKIWLAVLSSALLAAGVYTVVRTVAGVPFRRKQVPVRFAAFFRFNPRAALCSVALAFAIALACFNPIAAVFLKISKPSSAPAAEWLRPRLQPGDQVFTLLDYGPYQDFPPLLGRTIGIAGQIPDEQEFGLMLEPDKNVPRYPGLADYLALRRNADKSPPTNEQIQSALLTPFVALLHSPAHIYALINARSFAVFQKLYPDAPAHIVWQDANLLLISNQSAAK